MHPGGRPAKGTRTELGERIAKARENAGVSQYELARELGTTQQQIARWERDASSMRTESLARLTAALDVSADELLGLKPVKKPTPKGRLAKLLQEVTELPRRQQDKLVEQIENTLAGHKLRIQQKAS